MAICDCCGNDYDKPFVVEMDGRHYTFDAFECAIHHLAPTCGQCGCRILGHGVEIGESIFCCARDAGPQGVVDRV